MLDETLPHQLKAKPAWRNQYFPPVARKDMKKVDVCRVCLKDKAAGKCQCGGEK